MFVARQPILNRALEVYGYELLYRADYHAKGFSGISSKKATAEVLGDLFESGIEKITNNVYAFINFDYDMLLSNVIELINPNYLVVEILENIKVDEKLLKRIGDLKRKGYKIALDDFEEDYHHYPLVPLVDIIKYDILITPLDTIKLEVQHALQENKILLAEKVETRAEYEQAKSMGFHLFQGYFFSKPSIINESVSKKSTQLQYIRIVHELNKADPSYQKMSEIIEADVNLSYRLMKIIGHRSEDDIIYSIKRALIYMGFDEIERWINILMMQELSTDKPKELMRLSLVRAKFGEYIANNSSFRSRKLEISMMCLFSALDAITNQSMAQTLSGVLLAHDVKEALIQKTGKLRPILDLILIYEQGQWQDVEEVSKKLQIDTNKLYAGYLYALQTSHDILKLM